MDENKNQQKTVEETKSTKKKNFIDADNLPKAQVRISLAIFSAVVTAIAVSIFLILSEYFTIKSSIDKINYQMTDMKEEQTEIKDIVKDGTFSLVSNSDHELEFKKTDLDCKLIKEKIVELKQLSDEKKCK